MPGMDLGLDFDILLLHCAGSLNLGDNDSAGSPRHLWRCAARWCGPRRRGAEPTAHAASRTTAAKKAREATAAGQVAVIRQAIGIVEDRARGSYDLLAQLRILAAALTMAGQ